MTNNGTAERHVVPVNDVGNEIAQIPVRRVQTAYATAIQVQVPRVLEDVESKALKEATLLGEDALYGWGEGDDVVEGPTVKLANVLARCWGNNALEMSPVQETPEAWYFTAYFIDLETGWTLPRQFRQSKKWPVKGKHNEERKMDIRFQIGQSKAIRNVILNALPPWLTSRAMDRARDGVREHIEGLIKTHGHDRVAKKAVWKLVQVGATEDQILASLGRAAVSAITIDDLIILHGNLRAIESGEETADGIYAPPQDDDDQKPLDPDAVAKAQERQAAERVQREGAGGATSKTTAKPETTKPNLAGQSADELLASLRSNQK